MEQVSKGDCEFAGYVSRRQLTTRIMQLTGICLFLGKGAFIMEKERKEAKKEERVCV